MNQKRQNWSFEVVAVPQEDGAEQPTIKTNSTPVKVKIRVKRGDKKGVRQQGVISVPKLISTTEYTEKICVVHSDQTIMSFNMLMETSAKSNSNRKQQNKFFHLFKSGKCLGSQDEDENNLPYMLATPVPSNEVKSERLLLDKEQKIKLLENKFDSKSAKEIRKAPVFLGKCKRGGCLDPPFGEDKYEYQSAAKGKHNLKEKKTCRDSVPDKIKINNSDIAVKKSISVTKIESREKYINSAFMLYRAQSKEGSLCDKYSDSIITYPTETSSENLGFSGKSVTRKSSAVTQNSKDVTDAYFMPSKKNYKNISERKNDNHKINQSDEITCLIQSEGIELSNNKNMSPLLLDNNLVTSIPNISEPTEAITQLEHTLSQFIETTESKSQNSKIEDQPTYLGTDKAYELDASEGSNFHSQEIPQLPLSFNNLLENLEETKLEFSKITKKKKCNANAVNNVTIVQKEENPIDDKISSVSDNDTLHEYTGDDTKLESIAKLKNESNMVLKHAVSENDKLSFLYKDLQKCLLPNDNVSAKGSISENNTNAHKRISEKSVPCPDTNILNRENIFYDTLNNMQNNDKIISNIVVQNESNNVSSLSKLLDLSTVESFHDVHQTNSKKDITSKRDIADKTFQKEFKENRLLKTELQSDDNIVSEYDDTSQIHNLGSNNNYTNKSIGKDNENENIIQTTIIPNLIESKKSSKISLSGTNEQTIQLNKSQSTDLNVHKCMEDLNKSGIIMNTPKYYIEDNENSLEICNDINDYNVLRHKKTKINQTWTGAGSVLNIKNNLDNQDNKFSSEIVNKLITVNNNEIEENNIKNLDNIKGEQSEKYEDVLSDNFIIEDHVSTYIPEIISISSDNLISNNRIMHTENEMKYIIEIEGTTEPIKESFLKANCSDLFSQNTGTLVDTNLDYIIKNNTMVKQEKNPEVERFSQHFNDLSNNCAVPFSIEKPHSSVENTPLNIFEIQNLATEDLNTADNNYSNSQNSQKYTSSTSYENHTINEKSGNENPFHKQKLKVSSYLGSHLNVHKEEMSTSNSLDSPTINHDTILETLPFSDIKKYVGGIGEFDMLQQSDCNILQKEKVSSHSLKLAKIYSQMKVNMETKDRFSMSSKDKQVSQLSLQNVIAETMIVDLAFQIYKNESNKTVLKTFDVTKEVKRMPHDSIFIMNSALNLRDNKKLSFSIDSEIKLIIEINKNNDNKDNKEIKLEDTIGENCTQYSYMENNNLVNIRSMQSLQSSLAVMYENDLVPVEKLIKNLIAEIDTISKYRGLTKKHGIASKKIKVSKPTYSHKKCGCLKKLA